MPAHGDNRVKLSPYRHHLNFDFTIMIGGCAGESGTAVLAPLP